MKGRGVSSGYVEGLNDARTLLADIFSILLEPVVREGITGLWISRLQSLAEPRHALFRGTVRPAFRLNRPARHFLEPVVSDGGSGFQAFFEIAWLDQVPLTLGMVAPDAGETIGLQFHSYRQGIPLSFRGLTLEARHLLCNPHQVLHVMAHLMGDDIGLCEVAWRTKALGHLVEEGEVEVDFVISRAVEGTDGGRRGPASRLNGACKEYEPRILILRSKELLPGGFRVGEDDEANLPSWSLGVPVGGDSEGADGSVISCTPLSMLRRVTGLMPVK